MSYISSNLKKLRDANMVALEELGINDLNDAYKASVADPVAVIRNLLDRIERLEPKLGAFEVVLSESAMKAAEGARNALISGHRIGPFHGIPFVLKDLIHVEGTLTTGGTNAYGARISEETAVIARRLIAGGGILLGKTKTVELAYGPWGTNTRRGTPRNPWDLENHRAPGGSSSGTGVAVAARLATCGVGTDTGGSVRIPSAFCGLTGLKVTEGILPLDGIQPLSHTLDTPGPMCRSVIDSAIMFETMAGREPHIIDSDLTKAEGIYSELKKGVRGLSLGVLTDMDRSIVHPSVLECYDIALETLAAIGADLKPFPFPRSIDEMRLGVATIIGVEGYHYHGHLYENLANKMDEDVKKRIMTGKTEPLNKYVGLMRERLKDRAAFLSAMDGLSGILTPTVPSVAPVLSDIDQDTAPSQFTRMVNHLGFCALATPMGVAEGSLPVSLHVVGRGEQEATVLRIGAAYAEADGRNMRPIGWD